MSTISVKQLVAEFLNSKDEGSDRFRRLLRIATLKGVREFNMDISGRMRTQLLSITANHTVPYPDDYLDYSMIGIVNSNGEAVPLKVNPNVQPVKQAFLAAQDAIVQVPTIPNAIDILDAPNMPFFWLNYSWGGDWMHLYGLGGGSATVGEFTVDDNARCFLINPHFHYDSVLVEYLTNGYDCGCNDYMIDTFASIAFDAWLRWQDAIDQRKKASISEVEYLRRQFGAEKMKAKLRLNQARVREMQVEQRRLTKLVARA